jgi:glutamate 5-kinase
MSADSRQRALPAPRRVVVKIGSALLTRDGQGLFRDGIADWAAQMAALRARGIEVILVSSGSVAEGMTRLGWRERPEAVHALQAAAAVGQMGLVQAWEAAFQTHGLHTAQVLLVHEDLSDRQRYLNARTTLHNLLALNVVPVVNENDTVATEEIRFGDNDTLAALVTNLVTADLLVILTDQPGLFDRDPREDADAERIAEARAHDAGLDAMASARSGALGRGGMVTKVGAARLAARSGAHTVIASGRQPDVLAGVLAGHDVGTWLQADLKPLAARKRWLAGQLQTRGELVIDAGAARVLRESGRSLLPVGVRAVRGDFRRGELVACVDEAGAEVARGLVNYNADEAERLVGVSSERLASVLGYVAEPEMIHRDNLVVVTP